MPGAYEKIVPKEATDVVQDLRITGRVEAMAPKVESVPLPIEASSIPSDGRCSLQDCYPGSSEPSQLKSPAEACGPGTETHDMRKGHRRSNPGWR